MFLLVLFWERYFKQLGYKNNTQCCKGDQYKAISTGTGEPLTGLHRDHGAELNKDRLWTELHRIFSEWIITYLSLSCTSAMIKDYFVRDVTF